MPAVVADNAAAVRARGKRLAILLESFTSTGDAGPLEKCVLYLIRHQDEAGFWGSEDYPPWTDVITAFAIQILGRVGFHEGSAWEITRGESLEPYKGGVGRAIEFLVSSQAQSGKWGEDFFDTCQVLKTLIPYRTKVDLEASIQRGLGHVRKQLASNFADERSGEWYGPGFLAAAIDMFNVLGEQNTTGDLLGLLYEQQDGCGAFCEPSALSSDLCVWHTSLAVLAMHSLGIPSDAQRLSAAYKWLQDHQGADGSWGGGLQRQKAIFTSYGAMALAAITGAESHEVRKAIQWLTKYQSDNGRVGGQEGTIMTGLALCRTLPCSMSTNVPLNVVLDVQELLRIQGDSLAANTSQLTRLRDELGGAEELAASLEEDLNVRTQDLSTAAKQANELKEQLEECKKRWDSHPIRLSQRFIAISGWVVGMLALALAVAVILWPILAAFLGRR